MFPWILAVIETKRIHDWKPFLPPWAIAMLALLILLLVFFCYKSETATSSIGTKAMLGLVRLAILSALLTVICGPMWYEDTSNTRKSFVVFMIDSSLSMNIKDHYQNDEERKALIALLSGNKQLAEVTRIDIANRIMQDSTRLKELPQDAKLSFFKFDNDLTLLPKLSQVEARGQRTNIYNNLVKAIDSFRGRTISAIFILSDGQHNTSVNVVKQKEALQRAVIYASQRDIPIYTVAIGSSTKKRDIVVSGVEAPEIALVDDKVRFEVELKHIGYDGYTVPIYLKWGDTVIAEQMINLDKENQPQKVTIFHTFVAADDYNISIVVPEQPGEFSKENNMRRHNIKIIQQKLRVLYLENVPRWEYRYLKNALIRDETVLANTWLFSADSDFPQERSRLAPLLPRDGFPDKEELFKYHCVIIGDVAPTQLKTSEMRLLAEFVKDFGGGVAFIAGTMYNPAEYWETPLAPLLPVIVDYADPEVTRAHSQMQRLELTPEGKHHPIMRLVPGMIDNSDLWHKTIPGFYWSYPVSKVKPGATTLAINKATRQPLMATQFYGKGKTFFTALDSSWRWRFLQGDRYFYRFWGQVIRHIAMGILIGGGRQYYLRVDNSQYAIGEKVNIILRIRDRQKGRIKQKEWEVRYIVPGGDEKVKKLIASEEESGVFSGSLIATRIGNYKVWFQPKDEKKEISVFFNVVAPIAESGNSELNSADLMALANQTQGEFIKPYQFEDCLKRLSPKKDIIPDSTREYPSWDSPWIFLLLVAFFTLEWVVRKLVRML